MLFCSSLDELGRSVLFQNFSRIGAASSLITSSLLFQEFQELRIRRHAGKEALVTSLANGNLGGFEAAGVRNGLIISARRTWGTEPLAFQINAQVLMA
jgi:hypothetical protein